MTKRFLPLAAIALAVSSAWAAPVVGPTDASFYNYPAPMPAGANGELLNYRPATVNLGAGAPASKAWTVKYKTKDVENADVVSTGTVIVPANGTPTGVILYAVGTHGLGSDCAPSKQLLQGKDYENANIAAALKEGYAVLVSDYVGYTNGDPTNDATVTPRYMAGSSQGRNVLDIFKAATMIPSVGFSSTSKVAIWGYSQGGQASAFAAQLQPTYAPGMNLVGVASGGIPGDFIVTANYLNGRNGSAFLFQTVLGLYEEYPFDIPFPLAVSDSGEQAVNVLRTECVFKALFKYQNENITKYTNPGWDLDKMLSLGSVKAVMDEQKLGQVKINVPVYQYHGAADQFIPLGQAFDLKKRWCANGTNVKFDLYPSEHIATQFQGGTPALSWIKARFAGQAAQGTCSTMTAPVDTANPNSGDMVVTMDKWPLKASVVVKGLNQTVDLPDTSTFSAQNNINKKTLVGNLSVPDFKKSLKILGIGAQVGMRITPVGDTTGSVSLDDMGILRVQGIAKTDITVTSVWGIPFGQCKTQTPVVFPLNYEGPISGLGMGLNFSGTTTFPPIKGCIISAIISALMSGSGQQYSFTVSPPAPKAN